jgi:hypothetical protein
MNVNEPTVIAELQALADSYERALMSNDLSTLDAMFWQSPHVVRLGIGENLYGIAQIAAFRMARSGGSPPRIVLKVSISAFDNDFGVINVEFQRVGGVVIGRQSQAWVRFADGWRIVSAHVSLMGQGH